MKAPLDDTAITHVLDAEAVSILIEALDKEAGWVRTEIKMCERVNDHGSIPGLKARLDRVRGLIDLLGCSWVTCEHNGDCSSPDGCNHRRRNQDLAAVACGEVVPIR